MSKIGTLYIVATPIGNLEDITLRALRVLGEADFIAAEDTRRTLGLLNHFRIKTPLVSLHEHNEAQKAAYVLERLKKGESCALVSDAGMPLISDPGFGLVKLCRGAGISVTACPGACALITALALSGLDGSRFVFEGFLPSGGKARREAVKALASETRTIILYEAPHRIKTLLGELNAFEGRRIVLARELTKLHEEIASGSAAELLEIYSESEPRGEFVVLIEGLDPEEKRRDEAEKWGKLSMHEHVESYIAQGMDEGGAMKAAARDRGVSKREIYKIYKIADESEEA